MAKAVKKLNFRLMNFKLSFIFKTILFLFFSLIVVSTNAQFMDSIHSCLEHPPKLMIKLNNKGSFVANKPASVVGFVVGLSFNKKLKFGLGYNQVISHLYKNYYFNDYLGNPVDTFVSTLKMIYFSTYLEYVYYYNKHWEISIPIKFGAGVSRYAYKAGTKTYYTDNHFGFIYEATTDIVYKPVSWFGLGAGFGYRIVLFKELEIMKQFTSPIYSFGIKIYISPIYHAIFPDKT